MTQGHADGCYKLAIGCRRSESSMSRIVAFLHTRGYCTSFPTDRIGSMYGILTYIDHTNQLL